MSKQTGSTQGKQGKAEAVFSKLGRNVDALLADIKEAEPLAKLELDKRVAELKRNRQHLRQHFSHVSSTAKAQWSEAKPNLERAGQELRKAMQTLFSTRAYR